MMIIIDSNEQATSPGDVDHLREFFSDPAIQKKIGEPVMFAVSKLTCGDLNVIANDGRIVAIELKEPGDYLGSIADGRIFRQVENMAQHASFSAIIVTGSITYGKDDMVFIDGQPTNWKGHAIRSATTAIMWSACPVLRTTPDAIGYVILETILLAIKPPDHLQRQPRVVTFPPMDERAEILSGFPGVGPKRAEAMIRFAGTNGNKGRLADALMWASTLALINEESRPEGWGKLTIEAFRRALGLNDNEMLSIVDVNYEGKEQHAKEKDPGGKAAGRKNR